MTQITNKLLKQAIADAEAVRETAVANAKLVLEESITPQIREMIARRLRVEADHGEDADDEEASMEKKPNPFAKKEAPAAPARTAPMAPGVKEASATEKPFQDADAVGGKDFPADSSAIGGSDNKVPSADAEDTSDIGGGPEGETDSHTDWYDDWSDSDFDLDEVIRELEEDIAALNEKEEVGEEDADEEEAGEEKEAPAFMKKEAAPAHMAAAEEEEEGEEEMDEELSLEEILAELEAEDEEEQPAVPTKPAVDPKHAMAAKLAELKGELEEYRAAVSTLSERLQEVNLLNAKLLFTNKMFRNQGLNNDQKVRIVESFDRATTVREVKLVYTALVENLSTQAKSFSASRKKVVAEGFASKVTSSTAPKKEVIVENTVAKRLQELAGIL
jgi:hypothetical protein